MYCCSHCLYQYVIYSAKRLIKHTGFGNAAGLLMSRGMLGGAVQPREYDYSEDEDSDTEEYLQSRSVTQCINY